MAVLSGNLTAGVSLLGQLGIHFFYKAYGFLKIWWQAALVFAVFMGVIGLLLFLLDRRLKGLLRKSILLLCFGIMMIGLYLTFRDFRNDLTHRLLGERFHLGIYLYWLGGAILCLFFALTKKKTNHPPNSNELAGDHPPFEQDSRPTTGTF
ncbi:cytochrome d ubiquinol oxidase subunit II [Niabella terrae]